MAASELGSLHGIRAPGSGGDMVPCGINRRPQGIADVVQPLPKFVFQLNLSDAERHGMADGGFFLYKPPAVQ